MLPYIAYMDSSGNDPMNCDDSHRFPQDHGDDLIDVVSFNAAISACEKGQQWPGGPGAFMGA